MGTPWNPDAPGTLGLQWFPTVTGAQAIDSDTKAVAVRVESSATETVDSVAFPIVQILGGTGPLAVEVFEAGDEVCGDVTTTIFRPNGTQANGSSNWWKNGWTGRGTYSVNRDYDVNDVVKFNGAKYLCIQANGGNGSTWSINVDYVIGDRVKSLNIVYECIRRTGPGLDPNHPPPNATYWTAVLEVHLPSDASYWTNIQTIGMQGPVQEVTLDPSDYVKYEGPNAAHSRIEWAFNTSAWVGSGVRRITDIRLCFYANTQQDEFTLQPYYSDGDSPYPNDFTGLTITTDIQLFSVSFGPVHSQGTATTFWTDDDIDNLDTTQGFGFRPWNGRSKGLRIYQVWVEVDWVAENRVAYGTTATFGFVSLVKPSGGDNWAKVSGTDYTVLLRRLPVLMGAAVGVAIRYLQAENPAPQVSYLPTLSGGLVTAMGNATLRGVPLHLLTTTVNVYSPDSMPYLEIDAAPVNVTDGDVRSHFLATATADDYRLVRAVVRPLGTENLLITLHDSYDGDQLTGTLTVDPDSLDQYEQLPGGWYLVDDFVPGLASLFSGLSYYVNFACVGDGWEVAYLTAPLAPIRGYGGIAIALYAEGATNTRADAEVTVSSAPDAPTGFAADVLTLAVADDGTGCAVEGVEYTQVTWTTTDLDDDFAGYEVQRDDGLGFQTVATISNEAVWNYRDVESRFVANIRYRMRVLRADGSRSPWTLDAIVSLTAPACGLVFSSNAEPDLTLVYQDTIGRAYRFDDADQSSLTRRYARGYETFAYPSEAGSDIIALTLIVFASSETGSGVEPADGPGRRVFDPLNRIASQTVPGETKADLPYVCLRNEAGDRWFGALEVNEGTWDGEQDRYLATATFTETTADVVPVDVELTGAMVLERAGAWWDTRDITSGTATIVPDRVGSNDLTLTAGDIGLPTVVVNPASRAGVQVLSSPGWDDMWFDTPDPGTFTQLDVRWAGGIAPVTSALVDASKNFIFHQGNEGDSDFSWAIMWQNAPAPQTLTLFWSNDGTTIHSGTLTGSNLESLNRALIFDPATGDLSVYEQPFDSPLIDLDAPVTSDKWTLGAHVNVGATSLYNSSAKVTHSSTTVPHTVNGDPMTGSGTFRRISLRLTIDGPPVLDLNLDRVPRPMGPWTIGTYPPVLLETHAADAPMFGQVGDEWTIHNFMTGSQGIFIADRTTVNVGSKSSLRTPVDDALFDIGTTGELTAVLCFRWTKAASTGAWPAVHKRYNISGTGSGWGWIQTSFAPGGPLAVASDGTDTAADIPAVIGNDEVSTIGIVIDRDADTVEAYRNGVGTGTPTSLAAIGSGLSTAALPFIIGVVLDGSNVIGTYTSLEFFGAAVFRRADLTDDEWAAIHTLMTDPTAPLVGYRAFVP